MDRKIHSISNSNSLALNTKASLSPEGMISGLPKNLRILLDFVPTCSSLKLSPCHNQIVFNAIKKQ